MTKQMAHEILTLWITGARYYQPEIITQALVITGDITGPLDKKYLGLEDL
jgi:hypothetical protein